MVSDLLLAPSPEQENVSLEVLPTWNSLVLFMQEMSVTSSHQSWLGTRGWSCSHPCHSPAPGWVLTDPSKTRRGGWCWGFLPVSFSQLTQRERQRQKHNSGFSRSIRFYLVAELGSFLWPQFSALREGCGEQPNLSPVQAWLLPGLKQREGKERWDIGMEFLPCEGGGRPWHRVSSCQFVMCPWQNATTPGFSLLSSHQRSGGWSC